MADIVDHQLSDDDYQAASRDGLAFEQNNPKATAARYDASSGRLVIDFANGSTLLVPARSLQDMRDASDTELSAVTLHHDYYLRWDSLDVDSTVPGLAAGIFGTAAFMRETLQRSDLASSTTEAAASRVTSENAGRSRKAADGS